jgi:hypothetical protein
MRSILCVGETDHRHGVRPSTRPGLICGRIGASTVDEHPRAACLVQPVLTSEDRPVPQVHRHPVVPRGDRLPAPHRFAEEDVTLVGVGAIMPEVLAATHAPAAEGVSAGVVTLTSPDLVFRSFQQRGRRTTDAASDIIDELFPAANPTPLVTVLDGHPHTLSLLAGACGDRIHCLGVTEFRPLDDVRARGQAVGSVCHEVGSG